MTITQRIKTLLSESGKNEKDFAQYIGMNEKTLNAKFKNSRSFGCEYIISICRFFGVTTDFLLTGKEAAKEQLTEDERNLLDNYRLLSHDDKIRVSERAALLVELSASRAKADAS